MNHRGTNVAAWLVTLALAGSLCSFAEDPAATKGPLNFAALRKSERAVDMRIERFDTDSPLEVIGATRAVYLNGTGLVYSLEVSLAPAVGISPFFTRMPPELVEKIHKAKRARVPVLRDLMLSLMPELAVTLAGLPAEEDLVMAVTLFYFPYEKMDGLPRQLIVRGNAGALRKLHVATTTATAAQVRAVSKVLLY